MDAKKQAQELAQKGRYGDTMLMHINPKEVEGIASVLPITINPETGQPEMFIGAILGSLFGSTFLTGLGATAGTAAAGGAAATAASAGLSSALAGAIGSGAGTWAETGDIGKGITSAFLGYGVGNALGEVASAPIEEGLVETATKSALTKGGELASQDAINQALIQSGKQSLDPILQQSLEETAKNQYLAKGLTNSQIAQIGTDASRDAGLQLANMTAGERLGAVGSNLFSKDTLGALSQTGSYLPIAVGGGQLGAMEAQEQFDRDMKEWREGKTKRQQELYAKYPEQISPRSPYYTKQGGQIPHYAEGGDVAGEGIPSLPIPSAPPTPALPIDALTRASQFQTLSGLPAIRNLQSPFAQTGVPVDTINPIITETETQNPYGQPSNFTYKKETNPIMIGPEGQLKPTVDYIPGIDAEFNYFPGRVRTANSLANYGTDYSQYYDPQGIYNPSSTAYSIPYGNITGPGGQTILGFNNPYNMLGVGQSTEIDESGNVVNQTVPNVPTTSDDVQKMQSDLAQQLSQQNNVNYDDYVAWATDNPVADQGINAHFNEYLTFVAEKEAQANKATAEAEATRIEAERVAALTAEQKATEDKAKADADKAEADKKADAILKEQEAVRLKAEADEVARLKALNEGEIILDKSETPYENYQDNKDNVAYANPYADGNYPEGEDENTGYWFMIDPAFSTGGGYPEGKSDITVIGNKANAIRVTKEQFEAGYRPPGFELQPIIPPITPPITPVISNPEIVSSNQGIRSPFSNDNAPTYLYQEGGEILNPQQEMLPMQNTSEDIVTLEAKMAILGQHQNPDKAIQDFIEQYGIDAFLQFRDMLLQEQVPNAQTEGIISGQGGGMDDMVTGKIGNQQGIAVSPGEYIVPADVVSMLGDGSSDSGADRLDDMLQKIRVNKTGTSTQAKEINQKEVLPI